MAPDRSPSDAIGFTALDNDQAPKSGHIARRSVSIFSRRGADDQEPKPAAIARTVLRPMTTRQHSWLGKRSSFTSKEQGRKSSNKGTVLKAVPAARVIEMTSLEEEMATSPNEEILSAISEHPSSQLFATSNSLPRTMKSNAGFRSSTSFPPKTSSRSRRRSDNDYRIGTWINGVAHFDRNSLMEKEGQTSASAARKAMLITSDKTYAHDGRHFSVGDLGSGTIAGQPTPPILLQHPAPKGSYSPARYDLIPTIAAPRPLRTVSSNSLPPVQDMRMLTPEARAPGQTRVLSHRSNPSQSSNSSRSTTDESSVYSRRSSVTTVDTIIMPECRPSTSASSFSTLCPAKAGVFDDESICMDRPFDLNKTLPPLPIATLAPPATQTAETLPVPAPSVSRSWTRGHHTRGSSVSLYSSRSMTELRSSAQSWYRIGATSPTLSQAEHAVHSQLFAMEERRPSCHSLDGQTNEQHLFDQALKRKDSVREVMQPPQRAPTLPKKSRKREWRGEKKTQSMLVQQDTTQRALVRSRSTAQLVDEQSEKPAIPLRKMASIAHFHDVPAKTAVLPELPPLERNAELAGTVQSGPAPEDEESETCSPASAEEDYAPSPDASNSAQAVLLQILGSLQSFDDLSNTAIINKGMHRVYKEHEMHLLQTVLRNQSPAAYEFRELRQSKHDSKDVPTPQSYLACHRRDLAVIERLKQLIHDQCQSFLRRETLLALSTPTHPNAQRFNDAFWRIWCFCAMFSPGHQKGREDDITGQLDWLKGGLLNENQPCAATVNTNLEFDVAGVLLNAPEHFAVANKGGLSTSQLWDLTEIWNCYKVMLSGYSGRVEQAREHGVFDECDIAEGDIETEERLLEDWLTYVLTLGPNAVLDLALLASDPNPTGFALAKQNGWTQWTPPIYSNSLSNFLKEPVAIIYSEQVTAAKQRLQNPHEQQQRELSRKRVASMAAEIRLRRQSSEYKRLPLIDMKAERAMSIVSRRDSATSMRSAATSLSSRTRSSRSSTSSTPAATSYRSPAQSICPIPEDRSEHAESDDASSQSGVNTFAENTSEIATMKLVSMGFPVTAARQALRITDDGESLRLDRAVEYLLRQK